MVLHQKLFFLLLVFLPIQLGFHFWPEWSQILGRRVDYLSPTIYATDILILLILLQFSIFNLKFLIKQRNVQIFILFAAINIFFAKSQPVAIYKWCKVLEFAGLGWYIVKTRPHVSRITYFVSLGVLYSSIIAIFQFVFQHSVGLWILGERTFAIDTPGIARIIVNGKELLRPYATFPHPNVLGGYLAVLLPFITNMPIFLLGLLALFLTFSRSAWIVFLIGMGIAKKKLFLSLVLALSVLLFGFTIQEEAIVVRNELNSAAIHMWQTSPLLGVGLGNFLVELPKYLVSRDVYFLQPVHNIYLLVLAETGIVGGAFFAWVIIRGLKKFNPLFFSFLLLGLVDHYPVTLQQGQILFTILLVLQ